MSEVAEIFLENLPFKKKSTPSGWISFNAPCCQHNGHRADLRGRGGFVHNADGGVSYHCFNCGFKCSWQPGRTLSHKLKKLLRWLSVSDDDINKLSLKTLQEKNNHKTNQKQEVRQIIFQEKELPAKSQSIDLHNVEHQTLINYIKQRSLGYAIENFYCSQEKKFRDRFIIPFYHNKKLVGYTARTIKNHTIKYLTDSQPGYIYGLDTQPYDRKFLIVCEGPIDAMLIDGVALLGSEINHTQLTQLQKTKKEIVVIPDRDKAGKKLVSQAIDFNFCVSFPAWGSDINDVGDAVNKYGRVLTLYSILQNICTTNLKIQLGEKKWFGKNI